MIATLCKFKVGDRIRYIGGPEGVVTRVCMFGCFVEFDPSSRDGLDKSRVRYVHRSNLEVVHG